ncbi:uncharacterized protein LOC131683089 [Topomyia yanbarensis]|uniref:uncharacterized protein LOC131683089 n=1 Tax=Topomyia yanbarensis TaxID=2498891 RepID=UPI00273B227E|nr:uncharacterized protein LOC131683089 [Topomyia yanbarensis]XP_058820891.1 uncharacterized protein LOC131683089 [Topomyia yanbarensis]
MSDGAQQKATQLRLNCVAVDFSKCPVRPSIREVEQLLEVQMKLNLAEVKTLQMHYIKHCVLISFNNINQAESFASRNNMQHTAECGNVKYSIPVYIENGAVEVRVHDLATRTPDGAIKKCLQKYGEVDSVTHETWRNFFPGIPNGVRVVRMRVTKPIPSYITVTALGSDDVLIHQTSLVTYPGQIPTCQFCTKKLHLGKPCVETVKENSNPTEISTQPSYAKPLTAAKPTSMDQAPTTSNNNNETNADNEHTKTNLKSKTQTGTSDCEQQESSTDEDMDVNDNAKDKRNEPQLAVDNTGNISPPRKRISTRSRKLRLNETKNLT